MESSFKSIIDSTKSLLILLPVNPSFDQVAGGLSLFLSLKKNKDVSISCPTPMLVEFNRLVGVNKISTETGDKNLTIKFSNYQANNIERVSYDIENGEFKLTVIPKPGVVSPTKEQLQVAYSGLASEAVILIGGTSDANFPALSDKEASFSKVIHLGVSSISLPPGQEPISFARPASSVSEVIFDLVKESGSEIDNDMATNLLMGLEEGSKSFSGQDVTAETFAAAAELMRMGGRRVPKEAVQKQYPTGSIPGQAVQSIKDPLGDMPTPKSWLEPKIFKSTSVS
jgi:hypothetical protein